MIDRFTEKAKDAIGLAADAAESLGHHYVGTEHLLIGLIQEGTGVAARVLDECGVKEDKVVELISELISPNNGVGTAERSTIRQEPERSLRTVTGRRYALRHH